jgi:hypothetical protein
MVRRFRRENCIDVEKNGKRYNNEIGRDYPVKGCDRCPKPVPDKS